MESLYTALSEIVQNIERWQQTGIPATTEESKALYDNAKAALADYETKAAIRNNTVSGWASVNFNKMIETEFLALMHCGQYVDAKFLKREFTPLQSHLFMTRKQPLMD